MTIANPYVGPRTFTRAEAERFYGREQEARDLLSMVIADRLVLFYAQSGAGKSSLINARLIPQLQEEGFLILPTGRVSGELPEGMSEVDNIFIFNLLQSLDQSTEHPRRFAHLSLSQFLANLATTDGEYYYYDAGVETSPATPPEDIYDEPPHVLIIDQFEEIVTTHLGRWPDRASFFDQLAQAMADDPLLWVVLALREDYVAALDPCASALPNKMRARFYMQRMTYQSALEAIEQPVAQTGRTYAPGVAALLVDNLRQIRIQSDLEQSHAEIQMGQFIEPVQLQVVCYQLWENLQDRPPGPITAQDLQELGDVDTALATFYEQTLYEAVTATHISEIILRQWFQDKLITEAGTRGSVYRGAEQTGGIGNATVDFLANKFLLRAEVRPGGTWYELIHDRLIDPILQANQKWRFQQPLLQMAQAWLDADQPHHQLLEGQPLQEALASNWQALGMVVEEFIMASQDYQQAKDIAQAFEREEQERREREALEKAAGAESMARQEAENRVKEQEIANRKLQTRLMWIIVVGVIAVVMALVAGLFGVQALNSAADALRYSDQANQSAATAQAASTEAVQGKTTAIVSQVTAEAAQDTAESSAATASANESTAIALADYAATQEAQALAARQTAELRADDNLNLLLTATAERIALGTTIASEATLAANLALILTVQAEGAEATATANYLTSQATPTPNLTAEIFIQVADAQVKEAEVRQTSVAQIPPTPTPVITCRTEAQADFEAVWNLNKGRLGCPLQTNMLGGPTIWQSFENGYVFWSGQEEIYIVGYGQDFGRWQQISQQQIPLPDVNCKDKIPELKFKLEGGIADLWCAMPDIQARLGKPSADPSSSNVAAQPYEHGWIWRDSNGLLYVFFNDDQTFIRTKP